MIKLCNVEKIYNDGAQPVTIFSDFNFEAGEGEFIGVVGPIGSGKTTLLNIIAGVEQVNYGQVHINEVNITTLNKNELAEFRQQHIGQILQHHTLFPFLNCLDIVVMPQILRGVEDKEAFAYANNLLKQLEVSDLKCCLPDKLNAHQKQRVALASAISQNPKLLIVDELALHNGIMDYLALNLIEKIKLNNKTTIVMATRNSEVMQRADRLLKIHM